MHLILSEIQKIYLNYVYISSDLKTFNITSFKFNIK